MLTMEVEDFLPRVSFRRQRSSGALPFSPLLLINTLSRRSFSYNKLPEEPLKLTVLKLDGSFFDIEIMKTATIAELKLAVEAVFSHMPKEGPGMISWPHVWGHFCLCYDGQKLVTDTDYIRNYGIRDGDQLRFIRHRSTIQNLTKKRSKKWGFASEKQNVLPSPSTSSKEKEQLFEEGDDFNDIENGNFRSSETEDENGIGQNEPRLANCLKGWFSYYSLASPRQRCKGLGCSKKFTHGFLYSCTKFLWLYNGNNQRDTLKEV